MPCQQGLTGTDHRFQHLTRSRDNARARRIRAGQHFPDKSQRDQYEHGKTETLEARSRYPDGSSNNIQASHRYFAILSSMVEPSTASLILTNVRALRTPASKQASCAART